MRERKGWDGRGETRAAMHDLYKHRKVWFIIAGFVIVVGLFYWFFWDRPLIKGVRLNPYQADGVEIVRRNGEILQEEIILIKDKAWIREVLGDLKQSVFIKEAFPPDYPKSRVDTIHVQVEDGRHTKLDAKVFLSDSAQGAGVSDGAMMIVNNRYHYQISTELYALLSMPLSGYMDRSDDVEITLDNWRPLVVLNGEIFTSYFMGDDWSPLLPYKEVAAVKATLPDHIQYTRPEDMTDLLTEKTGTYAEGTPIYEADGSYFIRNSKETDTWEILLPEGQGAHHFQHSREGEVLYWESYPSINYFVIETVQGHEVYAAQDPNTTESCILIWDERDRRFRSPCAPFEYGIDGKSYTLNASPMERWPSHDLGGVLLYTYRD
ncbi:hypothetical protein ACX1C1_12145 [Paenibacillus sp. strain BS8-2]